MCERVEEMKGFGAGFSGLDRCPTPIGEKCSYCYISIVDGDVGVAISNGYRGGTTPMHSACFLRMLGVEHDEQEPLGT